MLTFSYTPEASIPGPTPSSKQLVHKIDFAEAAQIESEEVAAESMQKIVL